MLKLVPKPEGFALNNRRSDIAHDASKWLPEDAIYSAQEAVVKGGVTKAMLVAWYAPHPDKPGCLKLMYRLYNESDNDGRALISEVFVEMNK